MKNDKIVDMIQLYRETINDDFMAVFNSLEQIGQNRGELWYPKSIFDFQSFLNFLYKEDKISHLLYNKIMCEDDFIRVNNLNSIFDMIESCISLVPENNLLLKNKEDTLESAYIGDCIYSFLLSQYIVSNKDELEEFFDSTLYYYLKNHEDIDLFESLNTNKNALLQFNNLKFYYLIKNKYYEKKLNYDNQIKMQIKQDENISYVKNLNEKINFLIDAEESFDTIKEELKSINIYLENHLDTSFYCLSD